MTLPIPRTAQQIVARIKQQTRQGYDIFGVERSRLLDALPYEHAKPFLKPPEDTAEKWNARPLVLATVDDCVREIKSYAEFAWRKANECRGLSAVRSLAHFAGLVWLCGPKFDDLFEFVTGDGAAADPSRFFGKPALVKICEAFSIDWRKLDNNQWLNDAGDDPLTADDALRQ